MTVTTLTPFGPPDSTVSYSLKLEVGDIEDLPSPQECRCLLAAFGKCPTQSARLTGPR
jgi:hypothetical protein